MRNVQKESDKLRQEAKDILRYLLDIPDGGYKSSEVDRLIECIIGATVLEVSSIVQQAGRP